MLAIVIENLPISTEEYVDRFDKITEENPVKSSNSP